MTERVPYGVTEDGELVYADALHVEITGTVWVAPCGTPPPADGERPGPPWVPLGDVGPAR